MKKSLFIGAFFYATIILGMENPDQKLPVVDHRVVLKPEKIITIFNPKKELEIGRLWCEVIPGNMMITPNNKGAVIGVRGQVLYSSFDKEDDRDPELIIEHPKVTHSPMIAMAQKKDGSLLIVSAGNYINSEKKAVAEYILYSNESSKLKKIDWPIQAISLDSMGEILAIAGLHSVIVTNFETNKSHMANFKKNFRDDNFIIDIAMNPQGSAIIAVGSRKQKGIQWMHLLKKDNGDIDLMNIKQFDSCDIIKKIYYPSLQELLYLTLGKAKAKIIKMDDVLESQEESINTNTFSKSSLIGEITADPSEQVATAHWTNDLRLSEEERSKIEIYRENKNNDKGKPDKFTLEISDLEGRYLYITPLGQYGSGIAHLLNVALRGKHVIALASDGKMRLWHLPEKNISHKENEHSTILTEEAAELKAVSRHINETRRNRSSSGTKRFSISATTSSGTDSTDKTKKKKSPRMRDLILGSRESSPISSRENSPVRSSMKEKDNLKSSPRSKSEPEMNYNNQKKELKDNNDRI